MKKTVKISGSESGFKMVVSRKKKKGDVLAEGVNNRGVVAEVSGVCSWSSETGDTTKSESIDMEEKCLVEETSFDYGEGGALAGGDYDQTLTSSKVKAKKALGKPLGKINFSRNSDDDGVLSDAPLKLPPLMKNLVNIPVRKSFALDIGLDKTASVKILINTDLKKSSGRSDWAVVIKEIPIGTSAKAVCAALSEFGVIRAIKMQLIRLW
ncbi:hypothetical protein G9A89_007567 [Geosiphon pyriformis]|nr:hypothetical protein G9A89_007567 [Geosiphon pyriformis]